MTQPEDALRQHWDVIVVGTGMGGATMGYALARAGQRVLFCEAGYSSLSNAALRGAYAETHFAEAAAPGPAHGEILARAGRHNATIEDCSQSRKREFIPFIGSGSGGSTALYGMALERFFPADFEPRRNFPDIAGTTLPEAWPVGYAEMAPYYEAAERLYRVRGTPDPLRPADSGPFGHVAAPPSLTPAGGELFDFLQGRGLHPYRLPLACDFVPGCECCQGYLCAQDCKNDAGRICLQPALANHGAMLIDRCTVMSLEASRTAVTGVVCQWRGQRLVLRGKKVVLAAGGLATPALLQASISTDWPQGLANASGMVGRNLMRHQIDLYALKPHLSAPFDNRQKELAFNDFYQVDGEKLGSVQSLGRLPPPEMLQAAMAQDLRDDFGRWAGALFGLARPAILPFLRNMTENRMVLAATLEDLPYADNAIRVTPGGGNTRLTLHYRLREQDRKRVDRFRQRLREVLRPYPSMLIKQAENNQRIAHVCGTCRFGDDSARSVLDRNNRAHGLANLYIVDASFFPSSGGTNPALTIAANALRVAAVIAE